MNKIPVYQAPLETEAMRFDVSFEATLAEVPTSAVLWLEFDGVSVELPLSLVAGATTTQCSVIWNPSGQLLATGLYTASVRVRNSTNIHIGRSEPFGLLSQRYVVQPS